MTTKPPMPGPGHFQWNAGGWFGGQIGGTAWMLVGAVVFARQAPAAAALWLVSFVVTNAIGTWLWRQRDRLRPYPAIQLLLFVVGVIGLLALASFAVLRPAGVRLEDAGWRDVAPAVVCAWWLVGCAALASTIRTWRLRGRLRPNAAIQLLLLVVCEIGLLALASFFTFHPPGVRLGAGMSDLAGAFFCLLNVVLALMALFALMESCAKNETDQWKKSNDPTHS